MDKNEALSKFFKDKRKERDKTVAEMAAAGGFAYANYYNWENNGKFPRTRDAQDRLASLFGLTREELLEKADASLNHENDLILLLKTIIAAGCQAITMDDIDFLCATQSALEAPMSPELVRLLIEHRVAPQKIE